MTGFREPDMPVFVCTAMSSIENQGTPDAQMLTAILVAREQNQNKLPLYDLFVAGLIGVFSIDRKTVPLPARVSKESMSVTSNKKSGSF